LVDAHFGMLLMLLQDSEAEVRNAAAYRVADLDRMVGKVKTIEVVRQNGLLVVTLLGAVDTA